MPSNRNQLNDRLTRRFQDDESKQLIQDWRKQRNTRTPNHYQTATNLSGVRDMSGQLAGYNDPAVTGPIGDLSNPGELGPGPAPTLIGDGGGFYPSPTPAPTTIGDRRDLTPYPAPIQQPPPPHPGRPRYTRMPYQGRRRRMPPGRFNRFRRLLGTQPKYPAPSPYPAYPSPSPYPTLREPYQPIADPYTRRY